MHGGRLHGQDARIGADVRALSLGWHDEQGFFFESLQLHNTPTLGCIQATCYQLLGHIRHQCSKPQVQMKMK
jgi:hypothetical protein